MTLAGATGLYELVVPPLHLLALAVGIPVSRLSFGRSTGNNISGHYKQLYFFSSSSVFLRYLLFS